MFKEEIRKGYCSYLTRNRKDDSKITLFDGKLYCAKNKQGEKICEHQIPGTGIKTDDGNQPKIWMCDQGDKLLKSKGYIRDTSSELAKEVDN